MNMVTFQNTKLGDICVQITDGKHGDCLNENGSGYFFISSKDVYDGSIHYENARQITQVDFIDTHKRTKLEPGDILITNSGTIGRMAFIKNDDRYKKTTFQKSVAIIKPRLSEVDSSYLYYNLLFREKNLINLAGGAAQHNLLLGDLRRFSIQIPDRETQSCIASVLSSYDDLIENNEKRIKILEEMAQRLYTEGFVKFNGHEKARMVDSRTGNGGWNVVKFGDKVSVFKGRNITKKTITDGLVPVVAGGLQPAYYHNTFNTKGPVITISASGANAGFVNLYSEDIWASDCSYNNSTSTPFVYFYYLLLRHRQAEVTNLQKGAAQPHVYPQDIMRLSVFDVPETLIINFECKVQMIFNQICNLRKQNQTLSKARDFLIPQLITGIRELK